ncbi:MAG: 6,7-dimethyl-8-ribityllumazine synthase [Pseudomonadota bacterium]
MKKTKEIIAKPFDFSDPNEEFNLAIVVSRFNEDITEALLKAARRRLQELKFPEERITIVKVPGAIEIGLAAQQLAISEANYLAIICLGAVIRGETDHYDYVCQQVSYACQKVALEESIPVIFGVLTTDTEAQACDRISKGADAVDTALDMVSLLDQFED